MGGGIFSNKIFPDSHVYFKFPLLSQLQELEMAIILQLHAGERCCLQLRKPGCRTALLMAFGLRSLGTGEGGLGKKDRVQVSSVGKEAALRGSRVCGKRKNRALVHLAHPVLPLNISTEIKGCRSEEKEIVEAGQVLFCCFTPRKKNKTHPTTPRPCKKTPPQPKTRATPRRPEVKL